MGPGDEHDKEQPLAGGRVTGGVVRVGDTVRRSASPASRFVARLLSHLAKSGFDGCPQHLGWDQYGRDMLSFVPGYVPPRWQQFTDDQVDCAAALLRQLHDATRDLASALGAEVVCHHDPGPNNTVFRDVRPVAFIDFDFAAPGHPLEDVGYMAWAWCISSRPDRGPATEQARQVRTMTDAYGLSPTARDRLPAAIRERLCRNKAFWRGVHDHDATSIPRARSAEVLAWTRRELAYVEANQETFIAALNSG
ncbi:aminoglycoside phosphotransferase family protein [Jiangella asiatica]|uniref:Aminoglycoside phosphotransferase family protein n=1 Tax=Jiangella asiatica TaxID=2530372 RepID=A0A4R5D9T5_9ACTN|nr:aminoglycoside phosphotransferase family protein [Jiangella asiatica]TDE08194.1 aminoglycoside phosphotransferase family protein [Jiangella asiatica]